MITHLYLVRHGQSEHHVQGVTGGWTDLPLTALGLDQSARAADHLADALAGQTVSLFSSDLQRASMTAAVIGNRLKIEVIENSGLREISNGKATGLTLEQAKLIENPRTEPGIDWLPYPEAETWRRMTNRVMECMDRLALASESTAIVVTHGGPATAVVKWWLRLAEPIRYQIEFEFRTCSVTELTENNSGERVLVRLNDIAHLEG